MGKKLDKFVALHRHISRIAAPSSLTSTAQRSPKYRPILGGVPIDYKTALVSSFKNIILYSVPF